MQDIVKQRDIDALRELRVRRLAGNRLDVRDARCVRLPLDVREEVSIDLDRKRKIRGRVTYLVTLPLNDWGIWAIILLSNGRTRRGTP